MESAIYTIEVNGQQCGRMVGGYNMQQFAYEEAYKLWKKDGDVVHVFEQIIDKETRLPISEPKIIHTFTYH